MGKNGSTLQELDTPMLLGSHIEIRYLFMMIKQCIYVSVMLILLKAKLIKFKRSNDKNCMFHAEGD